MAASWKSSLLKKNKQKASDMLYSSLTFKHLLNISYTKSPKKKKGEVRPGTMGNVPCAQLTMCKTSQSRQSSSHNQQKCIGAMQAAHL